MIDRLDPPERHRAYGRDGINRVESPWRSNTVPYAAIALGSIFPAMIMADVMPVSPPLGFMIFLCWRLMRPGLMPMWIGVPMGAIDDLFSGQPFGSGVLLFSLTMIALEIVEARFPWRGFWQDWFTAGIAIALYITAAMLISGANIAPPLVIATVPQLVFSVLLYPVLARLIAVLDRFRLTRTRRVA